MQLSKAGILSFILLLGALSPGALKADKQSRIMADSLLSLAIEARDNRDFDRATNLLQQASALEGLGRMTLSDINVLLGDINKSLYDFRKASDYFSKAYSLAPDKEKREEILLMEGDLFFLTGDYAKGLEKIEVIETPSLAVRKNQQMGKLHFGEVKYQDALEDFRKVLNSGPDPLSKGNALQNIGFTLWALDSLEKADGYFGEAVEILHPIDINAYFTALSNHALLKSYKGAHGEAIAKIDSASGHFSGDDIDSRIVLRKRAEIYLRAGEREKARNLFKEYFTKERKDIVSNLATMPEGLKMNFWARERNDLSKCFLIEDFDPAFLFEVAMFRRQTSLLGLKDKAKLTEALQLTTEAAKKLLKPEEGAVQFVTYPDSEGEVKYAALLLTKTDTPRFLPLFEESMLSLPYQDSGLSITEIIEKEDRYLLNKLYADTILSQKIWGPVLAEIQPKVKRLYFTPEGVFNFWGIEHLPQPDEMDIELRRVSTIPGVLKERNSAGISLAEVSPLVAGGLDYDRLPDDDKETGEVSHEAWNALLRYNGGNPVWFGPLPGTKSEADSIASLFHREALHQLSESRLKEIMGSHKLLHLATHGYSIVFGVKSELQPLLDSNLLDLSLHECGVVLTGGNCDVHPGYDDNLLSAAEISGLDLSNVDFVVLSACQTAKGRLTDEGSAGLLRGLKNAGAKTVVVTLWKVDDEATMMFMTELYRLLGQGATRYEAYHGAGEYLRNFEVSKSTGNFSAKRLTRNRKGSKIYRKYDEPYYWAPFILVD